MRTADEIKAEREKFRLQALEYRHAKDWAEAWMCGTIVSALSYALGETSGATIRVKLDK